VFLLGIVTAAPKAAVPNSDVLAKTGPHHLNETTAATLLAAARHKSKREVEQLVGGDAADDRMRPRCAPYR